MEFLGFSASTTGSRNLVLRWMASGLRLTSKQSFSPVRTPWFKRLVEAMFDVLNGLLLEALPGFVLSDRIDRVDYDPAKNGCIGFRHFLYILHVWLCDHYLATPIRSIGASPRELYRAAISNCPPDLLDSIEEADLVFAIVREARRLDQNSISYEGMRYRSPDLQALRMSRGDVLKVTVKVNPTDLSYVYVLDRSNHTWIRAAVAPEWEQYTQGLSLHMHKLLWPQARHRYETVGPEQLIEARVDMSKLINRALLEAQSLKANRLIARAMGIGTQNIFGNLSPSGELGPLRSFHRTIARPNDG